MIKLADHRTELMNLDATITALERIDSLIKYYMEDKPGPAYCNFSVSVGSETPIQFHRSIAVTALQLQRGKLVDYLAKLGIEV